MTWALFVFTMNTWTIIELNDLYLKGDHYEENIFKIIIKRFWRNNGIYAAFIQSY